MRALAGPAAESRERAVQEGLSRQGTAAGAAVLGAAGETQLSPAGLAGSAFA